jgi:hypothetical protein
MAEKAGRSGCSHVARKGLLSLKRGHRVNDMGDGDERQLSRMDTSTPERPDRSAPPTPVPGRCADLSQSLAGADPDAIVAAVDSLATQLARLGWGTISATPGSRVYSKNGRVFALDQLVGMVATGFITDSSWRATCAADGISDLLVPVPGPSMTAPNAWTTVNSFAGPVAPAFVSGHRNTRVQKLTAVAVLLALAAFSVLVAHRVVTFRDHLAGHVKNRYEKEIAHDGKLSVDGGMATSTYTVEKHEFESIDNSPPDPFTTEAIFIERDGISRYGGGGRNSITISSSIMPFDMNNPKKLQQWIYQHNHVDSYEGRVLTPTRATMAGGRAWVWEEKCSSGCWYYSIRTPRGKHVYSVKCHLMGPEDTPAARARCKAVAANLKINDSHGTPPSLG